MLNHESLSCDSTLWYQVMRHPWIFPWVDGGSTDPQILRRHMLAMLFLNIKSPHIEGIDIVFMKSNFKGSTYRYSEIAFYDSFF